jgi:hypothetical protein
MIRENAWSRYTTDVKPRYALLLGVCLASQATRAQERPTFVEMGVSLQQDNQPSTLLGGRLSCKSALDIYTWVEGGIEGVSLDAADAGGRVNGGKAWAGFRRALPDTKLTLAATLGGRKLDPGRAVPVGILELAWAVSPVLLLSMDASRDVALDSAPSYRAPVSVTSVAMKARYERARSSAGAEAWGLSYGDGNAALSAAAWAEAVIWAHEAWTFTAGSSVAYRDTRETRFRVAAVTATSAVDPNAGFAYDYRGVYDPYVTPERQLEARVYSRTTFVHVPWKIELRGDWGGGWDRATGFGPSSGPSSAPAVIESFGYARSYRPGSVGLSAEWGRNSWRFRAKASRVLTAFYATTAYGLGVERRF